MRAWTGLLGRRAGWALAAIVLLAAAGTAQSGFEAGDEFDSYFQGPDVERHLLVEPARVAVTFSPDTDVATARRVLERHPRILPELGGFEPGRLMVLATRAGTLGRDALQLVVALEAEPAVLAASPVVLDGPRGEGFSFTGELIVRWKPEAAPASIARAEAEWGLVRDRLVRYSRNPAVVYSRDGSSLGLPALARAVQASGLALWATPDTASRLVLFQDCVSGPGIPNDPLYPDQADFCSDLDPAVHPDYGINVPGAWAFTVGDPDLRLAVIDTEINVDHPDLAAHMGAGWDTIGNDPDPGCQGFPFINDPHGTQVAGLAAAIGNNGVGGTGVAQEATIVPIRVLSIGAPASDTRVANSFNFARESGAASINCSWGNTSINSVPMVAQDAIDDALQFGFGGLGCVVVWAAGNSPTEPISPYPAQPGVLTVSNLGLDGQLASSSSYGPEIDVSAPGSGASVTPNGCSPGYSTNFQGTSAAAPLVTGVAHLMRSVNPWLHETQVRSILQDTAVQVDQSGGGYDPLTGRSDLYGHGRVDAANAVRQALATPPWMCSHYGSGTPGTNGVPFITARGNPTLGNQDFSFELRDAPAASTATLLVSLAPDDVPSVGGTLLVDLDPSAKLVEVNVTVDGTGSASRRVVIPQDPVLLGVHMYGQWVVADPGGPQGYAFTRGLDCEVFELPAQGP